MKTVIITDLRTREAREAESYLSGLGYSVRSISPDHPLWDEEALSAFAASLDGSLCGVIHPAPPLFLSPLLETSEQELP